MEIDFSQLNWSLMMADTYSVRPKQDPREIYPEVFGFKEYFQDLKEVDIKKVLRYIPMVYDRNSPLSKHYNDLRKLKIKAADLAGFVRQEDGRFLSNVEDVLTNENSVVNSMITRYVISHKSALYSRYVMYNEVYQKEMEQMLSGQRKGKFEDFDNIGDKLDEIRQTLYNQDNNPSLFRDLDRFYIDDKLKLRPEEIADKINEIKKLGQNKEVVPAPLKKKVEEVPSRILRKYKREAEYVKLNDDPDLHPVWIKLPKCEDITQIEGYGLEIEEQYWRKPEMPQKLKFLIEECLTLDEIWDKLDENQLEYSKEIRWINDQIWYSLNGFWFFNNGVPTYIAGWHYDYLTHWKFGEDQSPEYRDRDRKWYHGVYYAYTTTETIVYDKKRIVYENEELRIPKMKDLKKKVFLGYIGPKGRRAGDSNKFLCAGYMETQRAKKKIMGIISSTGAHAKTKLFDEILITSWQQMPFFYKPTTSSNENPDKEIRFFGKRTAADKAKTSQQLRSKINYSATSDSSFYDGGKVFFLDVDEAGKCFGLGTKIRMYDGSVKKVETITEGELVMGNDSTPRKVRGVTTGKEEMFEIIPKKGLKWTCNRSHVLSLKVCDRYYIDKVKQPIGTVINMTVHNYLKLNKWQKKSLVLYRTGYDLPQKEHLLDPYFLGIWLGDGTSKEIAITSVDKEIVSYFKNYVESKGLVFKNKDLITYRGVCPSRKNILLKELGRLNLVKNKHIPLEYLNDSRENRLKLLAGLVDTDGHLQKGTTGHKCIEITQKREILAENIFSLASSLGFYCSMTKKPATMKREDGSIYKCDVYRVFIFGDLDEIPTKVSNKKAFVSRTKNRRDPKKTGFEVKSIGDGDYYGFAVDDNHLFLLEDGTVVHNTPDIDVYERHQQLKECASQGAGANIVGFLGYPSTVGEMESSGGKQYGKLCKGSFFEKRTMGGQTSTGLMLVYISVLEGLEGFVDRYGMSVIDDPTPEQAEFIGKNYGARAHIQSQRAALLEEGNIEEYNEFVRLFPIWFKECFRSADGDIGFNTKKINDRLEELSLMDNELTRTGNFEWIGQPWLSKVKWSDNPKGRWKLSQLMPEQASCRFSVININGEMQRVPINPSHVTSCDPYKQEHVSSGRMSDGGIATVMDMDPNEIEVPLHLWKSFRFVCTYLNRPGKTSLFYDDVLMQCMYFNSWLYPEMTIPAIVEYAYEKKMGGYLLYDIDYKTGKPKPTPGFNPQGARRQDLFNGVRDYIEDHCERECHADFLSQCREIESMDDMTDYDLFTAGAGALLGVKSKIVSYHRDHKDSDSKKKKWPYKKKRYS